MEQVEQVEAATAASQRAAPVAADAGSMHETTAQTTDAPDGQVGVANAPSTPSVAPMLDTLQTAQTTAADRNRSIFGFPHDGVQRSDITLVSFAVAKADSVLEKLASKKTALKLALDLEARTLTIIQGDRAPESFSLAAVAAHGHSSHDVQLRIRDGAAAQSKRTFAFGSREDRTAFLSLLEHTTPLRENVIEHVQRVTNLVVMSQSDRAVQGVLKITTYRITFTPYDASWKFGSFEVPLATIDLITRDGLMLLFACKDLRTLRLAMHDAYTRKKGYDQLPTTPDFRWLNLLTLRMKPPNSIGSLFAFDYYAAMATLSSRSSAANNGWYVFSPVAELTRLGFIGASTHATSQEQVTSASAKWRLLKNYKFRFSPTYPQLLIVSASLSDDQLVQSARFRSHARVPVAVWRHPVNHCVLARSSQPNYGLTGNRSEDDIALVRTLRDAAKKNSNGVSPPLHIMDARSSIVSTGHRVKGKGVETSRHYDDAVIEFLEIESIHKMRESLRAMADLMTPGNVQDSEDTFYRQVENTKWLVHIKKILAGARRVAEVLHEDGASVLVHGSDGWDRTPQLVALAQLILDPYYRTIRGFACLVEKEWCSFGHKFADRIGVGKDITEHPNERSPVMLQFLDCVWQMTRQFPTCFEFNEKFLLHISDALLSGLYGTFLYNSERERLLDKVWERTESVWTPVLENPAPYKNPLYRSTNRVLYPRANLKRVVLWDAMFFRWDPESHPDYMEYMDPVGDGGGGSSTGGDDALGGGSGDPSAVASSPSLGPMLATDFDDEEKAFQLDIDVIHDYHDDFRHRMALSDCSDMSDDEENFDASPSMAGMFSASAISMPDTLQAPPDFSLPAHYDVDEDLMERYRRGAEERTRQRAQGRSIREALQEAPPQSRIKYLEQLLSESVARELQLEAELDSMHHRLTMNRTVRHDSRAGT